MSMELNLKLAQPDNRFRFRLERTKRMQEIILFVRFLHRCIDADLGACRLIGKASLALEMLEEPAIEFVDAFAAVVRTRSNAPQISDSVIGPTPIIG